MAKMLVMLGFVLHLLCWFYWYNGKQNFGNEKMKLRRKGWKIDIGKFRVMNFNLLEFECIEDYKYEQIWSTRRMLVWLMLTIILCRSSNFLLVGELENSFQKSIHSKDRFRDGCRNVENLQRNSNTWRNCLLVMWKWFSFHGSMFFFGNILQLCELVFGKWKTWFFFVILRIFWTLFRI